MVSDNDVQQKDHRNASQRGQMKEHLSGLPRKASRMRRTWEAESSSSCVFSFFSVLLTLLQADLYFTSVLQEELFICEFVCSAVFDVAVEKLQMKTTNAGSFREQYLFFRDRCVCIHKKNRKTWESTDNEQRTNNRLYGSLYTLCLTYLLCPKRCRPQCHACTTMCVRPT